jgi:PEP-CTERM motif
MKTIYLSGELTMKRVHQSIFASVLLSCAAMAQAAVADGVISSGHTYNINGYIFGNLSGSETLTFSKPWLKALYAIEVDSVAPAKVDYTFKGLFQYAAMSTQVPVVGIGAQYDADALTLSMTNVFTQGGIHMWITPDGITNSGGQMIINNISVDFSNKKIVADVQGGNGLGLQERVAVWNYATLTGDTSFQLREGEVKLVNSAAGLTITPEARSMFVQSLGLLRNGVLGLDEVTDFGTMATSVTLLPGCLSCSTGEPFVPQVPEPSSWVLMALGLLGTAAVARRRA